MMPIRTERFITRAMLKAEPDTLFVFGDNLERRGLGGQAKEMRGEPNAVGIPTKRAPGMHPVDFFTDRDLDAYLDARFAALTRLDFHLEAGGSVVLPADGLGTGRARLKQTAPAIWQQLQADLAVLHENARRATVTPSAPLPETGGVSSHPSASGARQEEV